MHVFSVGNALFTYFQLLFCLCLSLSDLRNIMDGPFQAGALQLSEALRHFCMHWYGTLKAYTPSGLKQSGSKCFREAPIVLLLPHMLLLHNDGPCPFRLMGSSHET